MDVRRWLVPGVGAAFVALVIGGTALLGDEPAAPPEADDPRSTIALSAPAEGYQWASWRNVAVQVPASWNHGHEPGPDWCAHDETEGPFNEGPYVAYDSGHAVVLAIGCLEKNEAVPEAFGPAPERFWQTHLSFNRAGGADATETYEGWTTTTRTVGDVQLRLLTDDRAVTDGILDSATTFTTDQNGCDITSPVDAADFVRPDAFDVTQVDRVDSISVCQYDRHVDGGEATLMGSHRITGAEALALLTALQQAPAGGGPDRPDSCTHEEFGDTAIAVRLNDGETVHELFVYHDHCFGNGIDDGTTRRELTRESCAPLFVAPVQVFTAHGSVFGRCGSD